MVILSRLRGGGGRGRAWTVCTFKWEKGLGKKEGGDVFESGGGGLIPQCTP